MLTSKSFSIISWSGLCIFWRLYSDLEGSTQYKHQIPSESGKRKYKVCLKCDSISGI